MNKASAKPLLGVRILVAEDDPLVAFDIMGVLLKAGADVLGPAMSVERALELARTEILDCGVLDVVLRDGTVFPVAQILKDRGGGIVFYTGQANPENLKERWPEAEVLPKPAPMTLLLHTVIAARQKHGI